MKSSPEWRIPPFLSFHVYGCILVKHGKTVIGSSSFLFSISQKTNFLRFYKGDIKKNFPFKETVRPYILMNQSDRVP